METIVVEDYNPAWPRLFVEEKALIHAAIGDFIADIQHVGSTSVPGLGAKPIVDIMVVVRNLALVPNCVRPLENIDYLYMAENGIPGRHLFCKPAHVSSFQRLYHLHIMEKTHEQYSFHLLFRDYLRTHPDTRQAYQSLKREMATKYGFDRVGYTDAKHDFIRSVIAQAREEQAQ